MIKKQSIKLLNYKIMSTTLKVVKVVNYKKHKITLVEDEFKQEFALIDSNKKQYVSIADAKRVINGLKPMYEFI